MINDCHFFSLKRSVSMCGSFSKCIHRMDWRPLQWFKGKGKSGYIKWLRELWEKKEQGKNSDPESDPWFYCSLRRQPFLSIHFNALTQYIYHCKKQKHIRGGPSEQTVRRFERHTPDRTNRGSNQQRALQSNMQSRDSWNKKQQI